MITTITDITDEKHDVNVDSKLVAVIEQLKNCRRGGFATIHKYVSGLGSKQCIKPGVSDVNFISRFSYKTRNLKRLELLKSLTMGQVSVDDADLFDKAKNELIQSAEKTRDDVMDARREAHRKFYIAITEGVTVHLLTEKVDGETELVLVGGNPVVESVMIRGLELYKKEHTAGVYKPVNSRPKTLVKRSIEKWLDERTGSFKNYKLTPDRFETLSIGGEKVLPRDVIRNPIVGILMEFV